MEQESHALGCFFFFSRFCFPYLFIPVHPISESSFWILEKWRVRGRKNFFFKLRVISDHISHGKAEQWFFFFLWLILKVGCKLT